MKQSFIVHGLMGWRNASAIIGEIIGAAFAAGHQCEVILKTSDRPTDLMRGKFHAMCGDLAKQVPEYKGAKMDLDRWKAVCIGTAIEQEWLPAWDGRGVVPFRKSSENMSKRQYCDCIEVAGMIGAHFNVVWTDPKKDPEPC